MKISKLVFPVFLLLVFISCKPIYKCGEVKPEKKLFLPKIITNVIDERDSLCNLLSLRDNQVGELNDQVEKLSKDIDSQKKIYNELQDNYTLLQNSSLSQDEQYSLALKQKTEEIEKKSAELFDKERLLTERENSLNELKKVIAAQDSITNRLKNVLRNALLGFKSDELSVEMKNGKVYISMSDKLLFASGSTVVEEKGVQALKLLADVLNKNNEIGILIEGHTDNIPIKNAVYKDNWDLSVARATSIVRILVNDYKVSPERLTASGKGEFSPRADNSTPEGRAKNRRTDIILSPNLDEIMGLLKNN